MGRCSSDNPHYKVHVLRLLRCPLVLALVSCCCCNKLPQVYWCKTTHIYYLTVKGSAIGNGCQQAKPKCERVCIPSAGPGENPTPKLFPASRDYMQAWVSFSTYKTSNMRPRPSHTSTSLVLSFSSILKDSMITLDPLQ